eukprot:CAMPEP_0172211350 /NCGR_PEP_ID=MMETSP1050-20130122/36358_1 /TAXON_ID=233186 /ORGANISM="Cryptomonas curvata, Strain CCAP979/52" /LENGTH=152 /DNA_ID=CAMNT_0012891801 /DNA_START=136 /DNA_END=591 /DNA_ORIENTATION=-
MGNCCGCLDWGPSIFKKEEEPPAPVPSFRPRTCNTEVKSSFMTVSTEQIDSSQSDLASLLRQGNDSDGSDDELRYKADISRISSEDLGLRKPNNTLRRRQPSSSDTNGKHDPPQIRSPTKTYSEPAFHTAPGDLNPPSSSSTDGADETDTTH